MKTIGAKIISVVFGATFGMASIAASAQDNIYTAYPVFGDKEPFSYSDRRVNTVTEKGLVRELIVQCTKTSEGIMIHDHISGVYCDSKNECHSSLSRAIDRTCG